MREIKFRIWQKSLKRFMSQYYDDGGRIVMSLFEGIPLEYDEMKNLHEMRNDYVIQQYTGLKDKNGVEIYEGDIVERLRERGLVDFNDRNYGGVHGWNLLLYQHIPYNIRLLCTNRRQKEGWVYADKEKDGELAAVEYYYGCPPDKSWEVVGNIFEGVDK